MKFHIITIFPEAFEGFINTSIIKRGIKKKSFEIQTYKLNDFSEKNFKQVDDKAYGMHGQVISPEPLSKAIQHVLQYTKENTPIIYMSPSGTLLNQQGVESYYESYQDQEIIIICGHYEGIDQRIIDKYVTHEISIGEYVLTNGELACQVFIDAIVRHIPGVLGNPESLIQESFSKFFDRQKEHPVYTRPRIFEGMEVPSTLISGDHKKIELWKQENKKT